MKKDWRVYGKLFTSTFYLSTFTLGGGYVIVPLMKKKFVDELHWIEEEEMLNLVALAQSCPGPVAVNASILVGFRIGGALGAAVTILGTVLPPFIILSVISLFYLQFKSNRVVAAVLKGMQAGVAAVILDVVITMASQIVKKKAVLPIVVMMGAFVAGYFFGVNVMFIVLVCGLLGYGSYRFQKPHEKEEDAK